MWNFPCCHYFGARPGLKQSQPSLAVLKHCIKSQILYKGTCSAWICLNLHQAAGAEDTERLPPSSRSCNWVQLACHFFFQLKSLAFFGMRNLISGWSDYLPISRGPHLEEGTTAVFKTQCPKRIHRIAAVPNSKCQGPKSEWVDRKALYLPGFLLLRS